MNAKELNRLIEKYYNGKSTEEEEKKLRDHFTENDIAEGYETEKVIFSYYVAAGKITEPSDDFEDRIMSGIDSMDTNVGSRNVKRYILPSLSAAAGLLILVGSYIFFVKGNAPKDTYNDPAIAYSETMKILMEVSSQLNHGTQALEPINKINEMTVKSFESINKSTKIIEKSLKNLDNFQKIIDINKLPVTKSINK